MDRSKRRKRLQMKLERQKMLASGKSWFFWGILLLILGKLALQIFWETAWTSPLFYWILGSCILVAIAGKLIYHYGFHVRKQASLKMLQRDTSSLSAESQS